MLEIAVRADPAVHQASGMVSISDDSALELSVVVKLAKGVVSELGGHMVEDGAATYGASTLCGLAVALS